MSLDQYKYVPVLKARKGELDALGALAPHVAAAVRPLLEVTPPPTGRKHPLTHSQHLAEVFEQVAVTWTSEDPIAIDLRLLGSGPRLDNGQTPWERTAVVLEPLRVQPVPVLDLDEDPTLDGLPTEGGLVLRLRSADIGLAYTAAGRSNLEDRRDALFSALNVQPNEVDLFLDRGDLTVAQPSAVGALGLSPLLRWARATDYRSISLAGTSAPLDVAESVGFGDLHAERLEWDSWQLTQDEHPPVRYADYAGFPSTLPAGRGRTKHPALRYLLEERLLFMRREAERGSGLSDFAHLCRELVRREEYRGDEHCAGCDTIRRVTTGDATPSGGGATAWRTISVTHHLTTVTEQLSSRPAP